tara:strand:- start:371 stop:1090 length:720 start_codon:yes stop_codon:yes gene_type:complete
VAPSEIIGIDIGMRKISLSLALIILSPYLFGCSDDPDQALLDQIAGMEQTTDSGQEANTSINYLVDVLYQEGPYGLMQTDSLNNPSTGMPNFYRCYTEIVDFYNEFVDIQQLASSAESFNEVGQIWTEHLNSFDLHADTILEEIGRYDPRSFYGESKGWADESKRYGLGSCDDWYPEAVGAVVIDGFFALETCSELSDSNSEEQASLCLDAGDKFENGMDLFLERAKLALNHHIPDTIQ